MNDSALLIVAMADQCKAMIASSPESHPGLSQALHHRHLLWMSDQIIEHAEHWPEVRLNRWLGFIQCGMMANDIIDFDGAKSMFDAAKNAYEGALPDDDLIDHLNADSAYLFEVGGEG